MKKVMKSILFAGILLIIGAFAPGFTASASSDEGILFEVDTFLLNMRTSPTKDAPIIGQLSEGNELRTFDEKNGWVKTFYNGEPVWLNSKYLNLLDDPTTQDDKNDKDTSQTDSQEAKEAEKEDTEEKEPERPTVFPTSSSFYIDIPDDYEFYLEPNEVKISEDSITVTKEMLEDYHIILDPGHGGHDSGGLSNGVKEKDLTTSTADIIANKLTENGATVSFTKESIDNDEYISLEERIETSNHSNADAFISIHYDWYDDPSADGVTTFMYNNHKTSDELAESIHSALMDELDMTDRGIRQAAYYVLKHNQKPSVLLELGFMSNPNNLELIQTKDYQEKVAEAITKGLLEYFDK